MNGAEQLSGWFAAGVALPPAVTTPNLVDLARALAHLAGVPRMSLEQGAAAIADRIGQAEHYVVVLVDGLGMNLLKALPANSFLRAHLAGELRTVFPSTTATALTSLATGEWPHTHAVTGWWTYLPEAGLTATILPFVERFRETPLTLLGVTPERTFPAASLMPRMRHAPLSVLPAHLVGSVYSTYSCGDTAVLGYGKLAVAVDAIRWRVVSAAQPTFTYLYLPELDNLCHRRGVDHLTVAGLLSRLDRELARLAEGIKGQARLVIAADHGLVNVPPPGRYRLEDGDPLLALLAVPPSGDSRAPFFHVRAGNAEAFRRLFVARFGEKFALLSAAEAEQLELFGPGRLSPAAAARVGDFLAVARGEATLTYRPAAPAKNDEPVARHGGLSLAEMRVPLILA